MIDVIGIDIGANGAAVFISKDRHLEIFRFKDQTERDICQWINLQPTIGREIMVYLEKVHAMPKQGVSSTFKFGERFGFIKGVLTALNLPYELVTPQRWQKYMECQTKGDKNITKTKAQQLFPNEKIVHGNADALLIAEYGRRAQNEG